MISQNHNGVGNPNHDENGLFSSSGGGSKKVNINSKLGKQLKPTKDLSQNEYKVLKGTGMLDDYAKRANVNRPNDKQEKVDAKEFDNWSKKNGYDFTNFMSNYDAITQSKMARFIKFVVSGFDFNKLKGKRLNLNHKVFNRSNAPIKSNNMLKKVTDEEMQDFHKRQVSVNNKLNDVNANLNHIQGIKDMYQQKFGSKNKKMFEEWWNKSKAKKIFTKSEIEKEQLLNKKRLLDKEQQNIRQRLVRQNQVVKRGG